MGSVLRSDNGPFTDPSLCRAVTWRRRSLKKVLLRSAFAFEFRHIDWCNFVFVFVICNMDCRRAQENPSNRGLLFPKSEHQGLNVCNVYNGLLPFLRSPQPQGVWSWSTFAKLHCVGVSVNKPTNFRRTAQKEKTTEGQ